MDSRTRVDRSTPPLAPPRTPPRSSASLLVARLGLACGLALVALLGLVAATPRALAQAASDVTSGSSGYELMLTGDSAIERGATLRLRGVAYEALGLSRLDARAGIDVSAQIVLTLPREAPRVLARTRAQSAASGRFALELPIPSDVTGRASLLVRLGPEGPSGREFSFPVTILADRRLVVMTDRARYEPGETVHVLAQASSSRSRRPLPELPLQIQLLDASRAVVASAEGRTRTSGALSVELELSRQLAPGLYTLSASSADGEVREARSLQILERTTERLFATATLEERLVLPGGAIRGRVVVTTPSGSPIRGARVAWVVGDSDAPPVELSTDAEGVAVIDGRAPSYLSGASSPSRIDVRVTHPAHGSATASAAFVLARSRWQVSAQAENGALVPELEGRLFVSVADALGGTLPANQEIEVRGLGVPGGRASARTDAHGIVEVAVRMPRGGAATMRGGACSGEVAASFEVSVHTRPALTTRVCVPVAPDSELGLRAVRPLYDAGAPIEVAIERREGARGRPVLLELLAGGHVLDASWVEASATAGSVRLPPDVAGGVVTVRARASRPADAQASLDRPGLSAFSAGASVAVLVRPPQSFRLQLSPDAPRHHVRDRVEVTLSASSPPGDAWAALVARDEAMQAGEQDWAREYVEGALGRALGAPEDPASERLLRATLAASAPIDWPWQPLEPIVVPAWARTSPPGRRVGSSGLLRDPIQLRERLVRQDLRRAMLLLEERVARLTSAAASRAGVVRTVGRRVDFAPDVLERLEAEGARAPRTLGGTALTVAMLTEADPSFGFDTVARRVTRRRLIRLLVALAALTDPEDPNAQRATANEPPAHWLSRLVTLGLVGEEELFDPWGRRFELRAVRGRRPSVVLSARALDLELTSAGPDGVFGNADDIHDPFARIVPSGSLYATASGEDAFLEQVARIAPASRVLRAMASAYGRTSLAALEERAQASVSAMESEAFERAEGGGGVAYGASVAAQPSPPPAARYRASGAPTTGADYDSPVQVQDALLAEAEARPSSSTRARSFLGMASAIVREDFPATLYFAGEIALDAEGHARVEVPLADALTTYRIEAIAWSSSGWITSARTDVRVEQDAVIDAPVPPAATVGDVIRLPVRVENRTERAFTVRVEASFEGEALGELGAIAPFDVPARDGEQRIVELRVTRPGRTRVRLRALAADGTPLDAVERPVVALEDARLVRVRQLEVIEGEGAIRFEVPEGASERGPGEVRLSIGASMFGHPSEWQTRGAADASWAAWALAMQGEPIPSALFDEVRALFRTVPSDAASGEPLAWASAPPPSWLDVEAIARALGALYADPRLTDDEVRAGLRAISALASAATSRAATPGASQRLGQDTVVLPPPVGLAQRPSFVLLGLAPALRSHARGGVRELLREASERLTASVSNAGSLARSDGDFVSVAASLALSGLPGERARATDFAARVAPSVVRVGDEAWLEVPAGEEELEPRAAPTALLVLALSSLDRAPEGVPLVRTLARLARGAPSWSVESRALASASIGALSRGAPTAPSAPRARLDGAELPVELEAGVLVARLPPITGPGAHTIELSLGPSVMALARAEVRYALPFDRAPSRLLPLELEWDGEVGARDTRSGLRLTIRNRGATVVARPILEVQIPAGTELDEETRQLLDARLAAPAAAEDTTLRLALRPLAPGAFVRLPIPMRFSVGGRVRGLGVSAWDDARASLDAPTAVLRSREVEIPDAGEPPRPLEHELSPTPVIPIPRPIEPHPPWPTLAEGIR